MSTPFFKYCPLCDKQNLAIASFCEKCDADLMNTQVEPRRAEAGEVVTQPAAVQAAIPTETAAPLEAPVASTAAQAMAPQPQNDIGTRRVDLGAVTLELELVENPSVRFSIKPGQSVGRSDRADVVLSGVPNLEFISRAHARFTQRRTQWYVQYIAEGNSITVDGVESRDDAEIAIHEQSVVVLSYTPFRVRLG